MVVWGGGGRQRVRRRMEALRRVERMREDARGSGGVQRSHLVVPTYLFQPWSTVCMRPRTA